MLKLRLRRGGRAGGLFDGLARAGLRSLLLATWCATSPGAEGTPTNVPAAAATPVEDRSPLVARGRGLILHAAELEARVRRTLSEITNSGRALSAAQAKALPGHILEQMIFTRLAAARATPADRARAQFESRSFVDGLQRDLGSPAALLARLQAVGLTEAEFRSEKLTESLALAVTEREVRASIHLPESDILKYYEENPARWHQPEQVRIAVLVLSTQTEKGEALPAARTAEKLEQLKKLREQIRAGGDFAALVKQYSEDLTTRETGGEYTLVRGQLDPALEKAAFALQPGELSEIVITPYGLQLLLGRERIPARQQPLTAVAADIRTLLLRREQELRTPEYAARLRREAGVEILPVTPP